MKTFKLYDEVQLTEPCENFTNQFPEGHVFTIVGDAKNRGWYLKDKDGNILNDVAEDYLDYSDRHKELQLDYNMELIANFIKHVQEELDLEIGDDVFVSFFNE